MSSPRPVVCRAMSWRFTCSNTMIATRTGEGSLREKQGNGGDKGMLPLGTICKLLMLLAASLHGGAEDTDPYSLRIVEFGRVARPKQEKCRGAPL